MAQILKVLLRGPVEDAFVYRSTLLCWTYSGSLLEVPVRSVEEGLSRRFGDSGLAASYVLFHTGGMGSSSEQSFAYHYSDSGPEGGTAAIELDLSMIEHVEHRLAIDADDVLDMLAYADRLYLATDGGLYSSDLVGGDEGAVAQARQRIAAATYGASASYGSVAASCGDAGLQMLFDDFGWSGQRLSDSPRRISDVSVRAEYASGRLLNYLSRSEVELFRGTLEEAKGPGAPRDAEVMVDLERSDQDASDLLDKFDSDDAALVSSWLSRLVVVSGGAVMSRTLRRHQDRLAALGEVRMLGRYEGRPVSVVPVRDHLLVETTEELLVISPDASDRGGAFEKVGLGPVVSLRSFPRSKRYRDMALATTEDGLNLLGLPRSLRLDA